MSKLIYKYIGPEHIEKIFSTPEKITLKCSTPKDFNDPYELFLTMDFNIDPESLAVYAEAIGDLPQLPTTCFSSSPIIVPMWAHYAQNHEGFVVELSEEELTRAVPESRIDEVRYSDEPLDDFSDLIARVLHIAKPRYTYFLWSAVFNAAYFTKTSCWSYEKERRMIAPMQAIRRLGDIMLLDLPATAIRSIICGARASEKTKSRLQNLSKEFQCGFYETRIGKSSAIPFLVSSDGGSFTFNKDGIAESEFYCEECLEPSVSEHNMCSWCRIDDDMRLYAASRNPYRILDRIGALEQYVREMDGVSGRHIQRKATDK